MIYTYMYPLYILDIFENTYSNSNCENKSITVFGLDFFLKRPETSRIR